MKKVTTTRTRIPTGTAVQKNSVRSFVKARKQALNAVPLFNEESPSDSIPQHLVQEARKTGMLNLASKNLSQIPAKVWSLNEIQMEEKDALSVALDSSSDQRWWEFEELQKLVVANNCISLVPADIQRLTCLQIFDAHDNHIGAIPKELGTLDNLTKVDLSRNRLAILPVEFFQLRKLTDLRLANNNIQELNGDVGNLSNLTILDLSNNRLTKLPSDIGFLSALTTLTLSKNKLEQLPPDFSSLTGLRHLDLSENSLTDIGSLLAEFCHIEILYLQENKLKRIPNLQNASRLVELYMRHNQVRKFSSSAFTSTQIHFIDLRANKISEMDIALEDCRQLDRLLLDNNDIETLPPDLPFLPSLKQLTLEGNPLRGIRVDIVQRGSVELLKYLRGKHVGPPPGCQGSPICDTVTTMRKIRNSSGTLVPTVTMTTIEPLVIDGHKLKASGHLNLTGRKLGEIPNTVFVTAAESKVNKIDLSGNILNELPSAFESCCAKLRELNLDQNKFTDLPPFIGPLSPHLYYLTFQNNQIKDLPQDYIKLGSLREINLSFNKFTTIPSCLYQLPVLEILLAQDNKIEAIDVEGLKLLPRLATLVLDNNNIALCPPELGYLPLMRFSIQGNPFRIPGHNVLAKGTEATLAYLRNRIPPPN